MTAAPASLTLSTPRGPRATGRLDRPQGIGALLPGNRDDDTLVLRHAAAVAAALEQPLTIARVIDPTPAGAPADPVDWHLRALELRAELERIKASEAARTRLEIRADVLEGGSAAQLCRWAAAQALDLLVLSAGDDAFPGLLVQSRTSDSALSLLIVPNGPCGDAMPPYARILVPLDGSARAESALPLAVHLARAHKAELLLVHVVPPLELTEAGPLSREDLDLRQRVRCRNETVARAYLERLQTRIDECVRPARTIIVGDGDVRRHLTSMIAREAVDLVVLSAHGHGASDGTCGSVAAYLVARGTVPLLLRHDASCRERPRVVRQNPVGALPNRMANGRL
jgi:nucleotide-binding universal stress UspA family protein